MGKRGPQATPTKVLKLRGSWRGDVRGNEPKPKLGVPNPPSCMPKEAKAEWKRIVGELSTLKLIAKIDRAALTMLCNSWSDYITAFNEIKKQGAVLVLYKTHVIEVNGEEIAAKDFTGTIKNPNVAVMNDAFNRWHKLSKEFGLSPASRASLSVEKPDEGDALDKLMKTHRMKIA